MEVRAQNVWDGTADVAWYDASQTSFNITTPEQLAGVAQLVNNGTTTFNGVTLNLMNDIWLNSTGDSTNNWVPIGGGSPTSQSPSTGNSFQGHFNGHGHSIYNLYCDKGNTYHAGLFCSIKNPCTIDSLAMINPVLKSKGMMGAIAGFTRSGGQIYVRNCMVINARLQGVQGSENIGCIIGASYDNGSGNYVQNCGATGTVIGNYVGGLGGNADFEHFTNCYFAGTLCNNGSNAGSLVAWSSFGSITNCYACYTFVCGSGGSNGTAVSQALMQSDSMITLLGSAFMRDCGYNNGYPILSCMAGISPTTAELCVGENVTLSAYGYSSYLWSTGDTTAEITVAPTTTTTYTVLCSSIAGNTDTLSSTVTVYPQAVITAEIMPSYDGLVHGSLNQNSFTVPCGGSDAFTMVVTPDVNYRVAKVTLNGTQIYGDEFGEGVANIMVSPGGTLGEVKVYLDNTYTVTTTAVDVNGDTIDASGLVVPYGANGVYSVFASDSLVMSFNNTARWKLTDVEVDNISVGLVPTYTIYNVHENHTVLITYVDSCGIYSIPFFEDFESVSSGLPDCYEKNAANSSYPRVSTSSAYQGRSLYAYNYQYDANAAQVPCLILPKMDETIDLSTLMIQFYGRVASTSAYFVVGVMTDPADMSTFTAVQTMTPTAATSYEPYSAYFSNYVDTGRYIAIKLAATSYCTMNIDNLTIDYAPQCSPITNLQVNHIYGTNATLTWYPTVVGTPDQYNLIVTDLSQSTSTTYTTTDTTYLLTGLSEQTPYQVSIYTACTNGQTSDTVSVSFTTICNSMSSVTVAAPISSSYNNSLPADDCYQYGYSQQIILASELGSDSASFTSLSLQCASGSGVRHWDIYAAQVTNSYLMDWILPSETVIFHHIFSGNVTISSAGPDHWFDIQLDSALQYNGTDNILLSIAVDNLNTDCSISYYCHADANWNYISLSDMNDSYPYSYTNPMASSEGYAGALPLANNIRFSSCLQENCVRPNTLVASNVTSNSADVSWVAVGSETSWELEYKTSTDTSWTSLGTLSSTQYSFASLQPNKNYSVRVRAICSATESSLWSDVTVFHTECGTISTLPYTENFEDVNSLYNSSQQNYITCWYRYASDPSHYVYIPSNNHAHSGSHFLDFHHTNNCYNIAIMPALDSTLNVNDLQVHFYACKSGTTGYLEVGMMSDYSDPTTFEVIDTIDLSSYAVYEYASLYVSLANYTGSADHIAFRVSNAISCGYYLDDITVEEIPACTFPTNLHASNIGPDEVTLTWNASGSANEYALYLEGAGGTVYYTVYDTTITIQNLLSATSYSASVRSLCGNDSSVLSTACSFMTGCDAITISAGNPWTEGFESYTNAGGSQIQPFLCWARPVVDNAYQGSPFVYVNYSYAAHTGSNTAQFKGTTSMLALPEFTNDIHDLRLSFWATATIPSVSHIEVGVITDLDDPTTFVPLADAGTPGPRGHGGNFMGPFDFDTISVTSGRIALRYTSTNAPESCNLDDFTVELIPDCPSPEKDSVTVSNIGNHAATISFVDHDATHTEWVVYYRASADTVWNTMTTTTTTVDLTNLDAQTTYYVYVETACAPGLVADATFTIHFTTLVACPAPAGVTINNINTTSATVNWSGNALSYVLEYGPSGFTPGTGEGTIVTTDSNAYDISGLTPTTGYTVYIYADCGDEGYSSMITRTFTTLDACPAPTGLTVYSITSTSASVTWNGNATNYIIEYGPTGFTPGDSTSTMVTTSANIYDFTGLIPATGYTVYIKADCGTDGYSSSTSTTFTTDLCAPADKCTYTFTLTSVHNAWIGHTLRVTQGGVAVAVLSFASGSSYTTTVDLCDNIPVSLEHIVGGGVPFHMMGHPSGITVAKPDGTVEYSTTDMDNYTTYTFTPNCNASIPDTCDVPTALAVNNIDQTSATATWSAGGTETSWNVEYKAVSATVWQSATTNATSFAMTGLTPNTQYEVRVRAVCDTNMTSDWTEIVTFTTAQEQQTCPAPTNLTAALDEDNHTTVILTWQQEPNTATEWQVNYRQTTESEWTSTIANATTHTLTDLVPNVTYEFNVVAHCTNGLTSDPSNTVTIQTDNVGVQNWLEKSVTLYPNPATEMVSVAVSDANIMITGVEVYNVYGQLINTIVSTENPLRINVSGLADGMYYVRVTTDSGVVTKNFVKR